MMTVPLVSVKRRSISIELTREIPLHGLTTVKLCIYVVRKSPGRVRRSRRRARAAAARTHHICDMLGNLGVVEGKWNHVHTVHMKN